jgi:hypothetical protein
VGMPTPVMTLMPGALVSLTVIMMQMLQARTDLLVFVLWRVESLSSMQNEGRLVYIYEE